MPDFTGEQIEFFLTPEGRRKVDEFVAGAADESNDFDINEAIDRGNEDSVLAMCGYSPEYIAMWRRICDLATNQPHVHPDMDGERFARILSVEKRPSTLDGAPAASEPALSHITIHVYDGDSEAYSDEDETGTIGARVPSHRHSYGDGEELNAVKTIGWLLAENKHFDVRFFNN